jgi:glyoxylase-like metal-dependent hydrolase (beta-lactamase superfamily II)
MRFTRLTVASPLPYTGGTVHAFLVHGAVPTLIDAPSDAPDFIAQVETALAEAGDGPLQQLLATHAHPDHVAGAAALAARFPGCRRLKRPWPGRDELSGVTWDEITGEPMLPAGDSRLCVIETPGHAPDHLCFFDISDGVMFAGDLVINGGSVTIPASAGGSLAQYLQSLRKVLALQPRRMLPSHGSDVDQPTSLLRGYISHRMLRERQILEVLAAGSGVDADAIVERLYASVAAPLKRAARENVMAHLIKLEQDGQVCVDRDAWRLVAR